MTNLRCVVCGAAEDTAFLCNRCTDGLERHLAELPALFAELTVTETRQGRTYRAGGRSERDAEPPYDPEADVEPRLRSAGGRIALRGFALPYDEAASVLRDECWTTVTAWARHLSESRGVEIPLPQRWVRRTLLMIDRNRITGWLNDWAYPTDAEIRSALCTWLVAHVDAVRMDEAAAEMVDEIADVHRRLTRHIDSSPSRTFWGRCDAGEDDDKCGRDLYGSDKATTIRCDGHRGDGVGCGAVKAIDEVRGTLRGLTEKALVTIDEVVFAVDQLFGPGKRLPSGANWRGWINRKQLRSVGKNRQGELLFHGADVIEKIETFSPRSGRMSA